LLHPKTHKYTSISPDKKTHNQIAHLLTDKRWQSNTVDVWPFRGADCDTDHYLVVVKVRQRLSESKQVAQKFDMERFNFQKLDDVEVKEQYQLKSQTGVQLWKTWMMMIR